MSLRGIFRAQGLLSFYIQQLVSVKTRTLTVTPEKQAAPDSANLSHPLPTRAAAAWAKMQRHPSRIGFHCLQQVSRRPLQRPLLRARPLRFACPGPAAARPSPATRTAATCASAGGGEPRAASRRPPPRAELNPAAWPRTPSAGGSRRAAPPPPLAALRSHLPDPRTLSPCSRGSGS